jgi:hypothetical protein
MSVTSRKPSYLSFDAKSYPWKPGIDYRKHPEKYCVGKGEQGVLICEPYKSELVAHWQFKTPQLARKSSRIIYKMFQDYLDSDDFVGADMARKFLQMGFTRARRYANYNGGKKYDKENDFALEEKGTGDPLKAESAEIFFKVWKKAEAVKKYGKQKAEWRQSHG